eukprot:4650689-Pyramimonas_sp.AAC.1
MFKSDLALAPGPGALAPGSATRRPAKPAGGAQKATARRVESRGTQSRTLRRTWRSSCSTAGRLQQMRRRRNL